MLEGVGARQHVAQAARGDSPAQPGARVARPAKTQLLANVSHELRTPLVSIKGYNDLLLRGTLGPINARQRRGPRDRGGQHAAPRRAHRDAARSGAPRRGAPRAVDVALRSARGRRQRPRLPSVSGWRRATCRCASISAPSRCRSSPIARASSRSSARSSATPRSSPSSRAAPSTSTPSRRDNFVEVSVADRGIGIPVDARARIFDRFYQVDASSTRRFGGAGLGLALAKELVTLHERRHRRRLGRGARLDLHRAPAGAPTSPSRPHAGPDRARAPPRRRREPRSAPARAAPVGAGAAAARSLMGGERRRAPAPRAPPPARLVVLALPAPDSTIGPTLEELKKDDDTAQLPVVLVADVRGPVRARRSRGLAVGRPAPDRGAPQLLGRAARKPDGARPRRRRRGRARDPRLHPLRARARRLRGRQRHLGRDALPRSTPRRRPRHPRHRARRRRRHRDLPPLKSRESTRARAGADGHGHVGRGRRSAARSPPAPTATWSNRSASTSSYRRFGCTCDGPGARSAGKRLTHLCDKDLRHWTLFVAQARSSVVEHYLDTVGVASSIPPVPTSFSRLTPSSS